MRLPQNYDKLNREERYKVRREYINRQKGQCAHCGTGLTMQPAKHVLELAYDASLFPKGFLENPIHLHHSHNSGLTIGAVHARCNAALWQHYGE